MRKFFIAASAVAATLIASPAIAQGVEEPADKDNRYEVRTPDVDVLVKSLPINVEGKPASRDFSVENKTFFNVLDIVQTGNQNLATVVQIDRSATGSSASGGNTFNGSWTFQEFGDGTNQGNTDTGLQNAVRGSWNLRKVIQAKDGLPGNIDGINTVTTVQETSQTGQLNLLQIGQFGGENDVTAVQLPFLVGSGNGPGASNTVNVLSVFQKGNANSVTSAQFGPTNNFAEYRQIGNNNTAIGYQGRVAPPAP